MILLWGRLTKEYKFVKLDIEPLMASTESGVIEQEQEVGNSFLHAIGRSDLEEILTPQRPWLDFTMEVYSQDDGLLGGGGLGILKGDTARQVAKLGLPFTIMSPFYPSRMKQELDQNFYQQDILADPVSPEDLGHEWLLDTTIRANDDEIILGLYRVKGMPVYLLYESGLQYQYPGKNNNEHRLYQDVVLGFGGYKARRALDLEPVVIQIDEAPTALIPLAEMDQLCKEGEPLEEAKRLVRNKTLFTNHTLVVAAEAVFSQDQIERYVVKNLETEETKEWLRELVTDHGGFLNLSTIAIELSGRRNGVSKVHAEAASSMFKESDGTAVEFHPVTNGISLDRWVQAKLLELYQDSGIIDEYDLPGEGYEEKIDALDPSGLKMLKDQGHSMLRNELTLRKDQYGKAVLIPETAKIACWAKRFADYKRPEMLFSDPQRLAEILKFNDMHVILSGKAHPTDEKMKSKLQVILKIIDANPVLKERVHFIQNYDEELAKHLVAGVDIGFNTPITRDDQGNRINSEADGTFWKKLMANLAILISTRDGGVADVDALSCFEVKGENYQEEVDSLYTNLGKAADEVDDIANWEKRVKGQLKTYLPIISPSRMIRDYIEFMLPKAQKI